jgi:hypothetical protein
MVSMLAANGLLLLQYILENRISASGIVLIAILQSLVSTVFSCRKKPFPVWLTVLFMLGYAAVSVFTYSTPFDIFPLLAVWCFALGVVQKASAVCRIFTVFNSILWLVYDILLAPAAVLTHAIVLLFTVVGILRHDRDEWRTAWHRLLAKKKTK